MGELRRLQGVDYYLIVTETKEMQIPVLMNLTDDIENLEEDYIYSIQILSCGVK